MDVAIVGMNAIGIDLYLTLKDEASDVYLVGQRNEPGMAVHGQEIMLKERDLNHIIRIVNENIKSDCLIYITNDIYYDLVMHEYRETKTWFNDNIKYFGVSHEFYSRIRDKKSYKKLLESFHLDSPEVYDPDDHEKMALPVIAKYNGRGNENYQYKSRLLKTKDELEHEAGQDYSRSYVFQRYYSPDEYKQYSYGCFSVNGEVIADIYVRQPGQHPKGVSTVVVEDKKRPGAFINSVKELLKQENHNGFMEFEILRNDQHIVVIDLNTRPWGWFYIFNFKYLNFHELASLKSKTLVEIKQTERVWVNYSRLSAGLLKEKNFGVLKEIRINRTFLNSIFFVYLILKQKIKKRLTDRI